MQMFIYHAQKIKHLGAFFDFTDAQSDSKWEMILIALAIVFIHLFYLNSHRASFMINVWLMGYKFGIRKVQ